jgi:hypothetical protein
MLPRRSETGLRISLPLPGPGLAVPLLLLLGSCSGRGGEIPLRAGSLGISLSEEGSIVSFQDLATGTEYLPAGRETGLLTLRVDGADLRPRGADFQEEAGHLVLSYPHGFEAQIQVEEKATHATFELMSVVGPREVELAIWGPYPTSIDEIIGETVGVVRGQEFALGLQALNPRTLGGYPWNENDAMPQLDIFESGDFSDLSEEGKRHVLYRVEAAKPDSFGSTLQAYARNRTAERVIPNGGHERYTAPPYLDGGILGSKIALFGCPVDDALTIIGAIESSEGLPHPMVDGQWGKEAASASAAYVIMPFSETTVDRAVDITLRAGLRYLYHPEPFETWGHFRLGSDFPSGVEGLRRAVETAEARGVHLGVHTLSNFITTNDPYVTPVPDPRLARVGATLLSEDLSAQATEIPIEDPGFFNQLENDHLRAAVVGGEIVRYRAVSEEAPWRLLAVERGAFGTRVGEHRAGDTIGKLADHAYRVFLTNAELTREVATNLADLFNRTGLRQISFDGLEGNRSTGMGNYGEILFTGTWYEELSPEIRSHFIADASRTSHYFWHIYTRMNWGEPWYAGFRESQTEYRLKNQAYFRRNMMPGMLGWFRMQPETSVADIEWMLARSAAFDAGYAFVTSFEALEENGRSDEILDLLGLWEGARMAGAFSPDQKRRMEDISREFHLEAGEDGGWVLFPVHVSSLRYEARDRQPGEPEQEIFGFTSPEPGGTLGFVLTASGLEMNGVRVELDGGRELDLAVRLGDGESLSYQGGDRVLHYSPHWVELGSVPVDPSRLRVGGGDHSLSLAPGLEGGQGGHLRVELRIRGEGEALAPGGSEG